MELRAIISAGAVRFVEATAPELPILGQDLVREIVDRYRFWAFPTKPTEFNLDDTSIGAEFTSGAFQGQPIKRLKLHRRGIAVELEDLSTDVAEGLISDLLDFGTKKFGLTYSNTGPLSTAFNSTLEVGMSEGFGRRIAVLSSAATAVQTALTGYGFRDASYLFAGVALHADKTTNPIVPGRFNIERRAGYDLSDNVYFTQAPLKTSDHVAVLEFLEGSL